MDPSDKQAAAYKSKNMMGWISDKVDVGMAKLRSDEGVDIDVAVLKATLQDDAVPKEKHVRTLKIACSGSQPRQQVSYAIHGLAKRLELNKGWLVTLKTMVVFHRLLREVDPSFQEELIRYQERTGAHRLLRLDGFADHTTKATWDYSAWIRVYSVYLDERLGVFKSMKFDPEVESGSPRTQAAGTEASPESKLKNCGAAELLEKLPQVQKLLARLISCSPEGAAQEHPIVLESCLMVLRETRATYKVVCEGVINLADKFFEMERSDAIKGLETYKENSVLNDKLNTFFSSINNIPALRGQVQMPSLQALPSDFVTTMEEYVRDAPKALEGPGQASRKLTGASAGPTGGPASTAMARPGGTTSSALTGAGAMLAIMPSPSQLKIAPPAGSPPPPVEVDLLGDVYTEVVTPSPNQHSEAYGMVPGAPLSNGAPVPEGNNAWGAPASFPPGGPPQHPQYQQQGGPPPGQMFGDQPAFGAQPAPAGFNPFNAHPPHNPFNGGPLAIEGPPGQAGHPGGQPNPFNQNPFGGGGGDAAGGAAQNPFGGAPARGAGPPQGAAAWGTYAVAGNASMRKSNDPLNDLGLDLFGKPAPPPTKSLLEMRH
mmetsp:Transcript_19102/g.32780  ORF Transcript_19102/g.32780 Transcript_19102/m.32780 type:complete len:600 (-) Transcript_19102:1700-3499(-)